MHAATGKTVIYNWNFFKKKKGKKQEPIGKHSSKKYKHKFKKDNSG
jgi:hypothetical protein